MDKRRYRRFIKSLGNFIVRLSIQWKITLSILITFIIILPSVWLSLFYFTNLLASLTVITDRDVALGRTATELSLTMLDIRRYEINYRMFGSSTERESVEKLIAHADSLLVSANDIAPTPERVVITGLADHLGIYSNSFSMLVEHILQYPPETSIQQKARLSNRLNEFQSAYRDILEVLDDASPAIRDSILTRANKDIDLFSLDLLAMSDRPGQPFYIQENLDNSRQAFLDSAHELARRGWKNMLEHREQSLRIEARAKRNIISVLILTCIVCVFMVGYLPRIIVRPITSLNRTFRKAQEGDFKAFAPVQSNDEIGDLAHSYNLMMDRLSMYDNLKTKKIASQKRAFDRFMENLDVPACIVTSDMVAVFYNTAFADIFGRSLPAKAPDGGIAIKQIETMSGFIEELRKKISETANNFIMDIADREGKPVRLKGRVVRNALMKLESIVLIGIMGENEERKR